MKKNLSIRQRTKNFILVSVIIVLSALVIGVSPQRKAQFELLANISSPGTIQSVRFSSDGQKIAFVAKQSGLTVVDTKDFRQISNNDDDFIGGKYSFALTFSRDQANIYYHIHTNQTIGTRSVSAPYEILKLNPLMSSAIQNVYDIDFNYDNTRMIRCGTNGFQIIDLRNNSIIRSVTQNFSSYCCKFSSNNDYAVNRNFQQIEIFNQNHQKIGSYIGGTDWIRGMDWNSDGSYLAFIQHKKGLFILNKANSQFKLVYNIGNNSLTHAVDWSPDDSMIALTIKNNKTVVLDVISQVVLYQSPVLSGWAWEISFSPDSRYLAEARQQQKRVCIYGLACQKGQYFSNKQCFKCPYPFAECFLQNSTLIGISCVSGFQLTGGLCHINCVLRYYGVLDQCIACEKGCLKCDNSTCFVCQKGLFTLQNGCTNVVGCTQVQASYTNISNNCKACNLNHGFSFEESTKTCSCPQDSYVNNNICHNISGCLAPISTNSGIKCQLCNLIGNFYLVDGVCACKQGFFFDSQTKACVQKCGDGTRFYQQCDDGNNQNQDGCSKECKVEKHYKCSGNQTHKSKCQLNSKTLIDFKLVETNRVKLENKGIFKFSFTPKFYFVKGSFVTDLFFKGHGVQKVSWQLFKGQLTVEINYNQTMEKQQVQIEFNLQGTYYRGPIYYSQSFAVRAEERELLYSTEEESKFMQIIGLVLMFVIVVFLVVFVALSSIHKLAGAEFIHVYLVMVYLFILQNRIQNFRTFLQLLSYFDIRFLSYLLDYDNPQIPQKQIECVSTAIAYYIIVVTVAVLYTATKLFRKSAFSVKTADFIAFNKILFPFTLAFFFEIQSATETFLKLYVEKGQSELKFLIFLSIVFYSIAIITLCVQFSNIFVPRIKKQFSYIGLKETKKAYVSLYIMNYLFVVSFLGISRLYEFTYYKKILFLYVLTVFVVFVFNFPYKYNIHNLTLVFNICILLIYLGFMIIKEYQPQEFAQVFYFSFLVFLFSIVVLVNLILNIARLILTAKEICLWKKQMKHKQIQEEKEARKNQESKYFHKYFYGNHQIIEYKQPLLIPGAPINKSAHYEAYIKKRKKIYKHELQIQSIQNNLDTQQ